MKKILQVTDSLSNGGTEAFIMNIYRRRDSEKLKIDFYVKTDKPMYYAEELINNGEKLTQPKIGKKENVPKIISLFIQYFSFYFDLLQVMKEDGPYDAVHCHPNELHGPTLLAAVIRKVPVRAVHSHLAYKKFRQSCSFIRYVYFKLTQLLILLLATHRLGCSYEANIFLYGKKAVEKGHCLVVSNPVDFNRFSPERYFHQRANIMKKYDLPSDKMIFLNVGRYDAQKNQEFILEIAKDLKRKRITGFLVLLVGFGSLEEKYRCIVSRDDLSDVVRLLSDDPDVAEIESCSDLFLLPSLFEGLPIALIEAQAMKLPCLVSDNVAIESNLGLCEILSIDNGIDDWSRYIEDFIAGKRFDKGTDHTLLKKHDGAQSYQIMEDIYMGKRTANQRT